MKIPKPYALVIGIQSILIVMLLFVVANKPFSETPRILGSSIAVEAIIPRKLSAWPQQMASKQQELIVRICAKDAEKIKPLETKRDMPMTLIFR